MYRQAATIKYTCHKQLKATLLSIINLTIPFLFSASTQANLINFFSSENTQLTIHIHIMIIIYITNSREDRFSIKLILMVEKKVNLFFFGLDSFWKIFGISFLIFLWEGGFRKPCDHIFGHGSYSFLGTLEVCGGQ